MFNTWMKGIMSCHMPDTGCIELDLISDVHCNLTKINKVKKIAILTGNGGPFVKNYMNDPGPALTTLIFFLSNMWNPAGEGVTDLVLSS
jgi:hypothetical protein